VINVAPSADASVMYAIKGAIPSFNAVSMAVSSCSDGFGFALARRACVMRTASCHTRPTTCAWRRASSLLRKGFSHVSTSVHTAIGRTAKQHTVTNRFNSVTASSQHCCSCCPTCWYRAMTGSDTPERPPISGDPVTMPLTPVSWERALFRRALALPVPFATTGAAVGALREVLVDADDEELDEVEAVDELRVKEDVGKGVSTTSCSSRTRVMTALITSSGDASRAGGDKAGRTAPSAGERFPSVCTGAVTGAAVGTGEAGLVLCSARYLACTR